MGELGAGKNESADGKGKGNQEPRDPVPDSMGTGIGSSKNTAENPV